MQRMCLAFMRFCLSAWVGIAIFFLMAVIELRQSNLIGDEAKLNHPRILFPLYYGFEFALLGTALVCAIANLGNGTIGKLRRWLFLVLLMTAVALAVWDYGTIYRTLIEMMGTNPLPPKFTELHRFSRWLNGAIVALTIAAAALALMSENRAQGLGVGGQGLKPG